MPFFGTGQGHPTQLNIIDCAAYALAKIRSEPLLFKGGDFEKTDIEPAFWDIAVGATRTDGSAMGQVIGLGVFSWRNCIDVAAVIVFCCDCPLRPVGHPQGKILNR
jgi:hypothetical protein